MSDFPLDDFDEAQSYPGRLPGQMIPTQPARFGDVGQPSAAATHTFAPPEQAFQPRQVGNTAQSYSPPPPPDIPIKPVHKAPQRPVEAPPAAAPRRAAQDPRMTAATAPQPMQNPAEAMTSLLGTQRSTAKGSDHSYQPFQAPQNPLAKYFRLPGLSIRLPTDGIFLPENSVEFTLNGEVQVFPMRAADELLMKSPDALMSGYAVENLIHSCVPAIKYPRMVSTPDLDVLLLAIRAASYGHIMEIEVTCPECKGESTLPVDLREILGRSQQELPDNAVQLTADITAYIRPYDLNNRTQVSMAAFAEARAVQAAEGDSVRSQAQINESFRKMTELDISMTADCILQIIVPEGAVTDKKMIREFVQNIERDWVKKINDRLKDMNSAGLEDSTPVACAHCSHQWSSTVEFDPSSFFASGS